jgi:hypothetical protein
MLEVRVLDFKLICELGLGLGQDIGSGERTSMKRD